VGRRLNTPRRILAQVLNVIGGSLNWETDGVETRLIIQVPASYIQTKN
jgi:hypothetical protein